MVSLRWQQPEVTYSPGPGGEEFRGGVVPSLTPETYTPALATESVERAQAYASEVERTAEVKELHELFELDLGGEIHGYSD